MDGFVRQAWNYVMQMRIKAEILAWKLCRPKEMRTINSPLIMSFCDFELKEKARRGTALGTRGLLDADKF